jgi:3-deoxy-manno-octulosonate cytidylyltransferase (CMP-KDO synthetase)
LRAGKSGFLLPAHGSLSPLLSPFFLRRLQLAGRNWKLGFMRTLVVIPARLESTRLPRKMLREIAGEPLLARVYCGVANSGPERVVIATDSEEILEFCRVRGFEARRTSAQCRNGTERVHEISESIPADIYVNIQGDELLARGEHIAKLVELSDSGAPVGTLRVRAAEKDIHNPNAVKVVSDVNGRALYFSRSVLPFDRDGMNPPYFKHLGMYVYRKQALDHYCRLPESLLEQSERLEQLRFLEHGIPIQVAETPYDTIRVDAEEDLAAAERIVRRDD